MTGAGALVEAIADLAATATGPFTPDDLLRRLTDVAARHLDVDGAGVMIAEGESGVRFVHATDTAVDAAERVQEMLQDGPCRDSMAAHAEVVVDDLQDPEQTAWPSFVDEALSVGLRSVVAVPLISRGRVWGLLDLYRFRPRPWSAADLAAARLLAQVAVSYLVMAADRDQARDAQRELAHRSTHDPLTGLPNRVLLFDRLDHALKLSRRHGHVIALLFVDLDRFKAVNDTFGHAAGDTVLTTVATRMAATLRAEDTLARLAGDEFVLLCEELPAVGTAGLHEQVTAVRSRLHHALDRAIRVGDTEVVVSASIGIAFSGGEHDAEDLLARADAAMYRVKHDAEHDHVPARREVDGGPARAGTGPSRRHLERQFGLALSGGQLRVHYQPITDPSGAVQAVEALLRWEHPRHGLLTAGGFIDLAAGDGSIVDVGKWVVEQTCAQMERWQHDLGARAPATAYVNLSARELVDPDLAATLTTALRTHHLQPEQLGLELVENSFTDPDVLPSLRRQQQRGHPLSVDDFGTGYSSLSRLVDLPVRIAKIDQSVVAGIGEDARRRAFVDAVVTIARSLHLRVVAEGVETAAQAEEVTDAGCHYLQGFHCGRPQAGDALTAAWTA